jgi:hypothetical protein
LPVFRVTIEIFLLPKNLKGSKMKRKLLTLFLGCFALEVSAQEAFTASGGNASGSGGVSGYSIGQVVYTTNVGTNGSVSQGVQQSFDIIVINALEKAKGIDLSFTVYPNPTADYLTLKVEGWNWKNLMYKLYDLNGKLLAIKQLTEIETSISTNSLISATYILKVFENNQEIKSFKIIKK